MMSKVDVIMKKMSLVILLAVLMMVLAGPGSVLADAPTVVGDLGLREYCVASGYVDVTLTKPQTGPNAAFNNWRCVNANGDLRPFSMEQACKWAYNLNEVQAHPTDKNDAYTWLCYSVQH
jgi:hypothetical protein